MIEATTSEERIAASQILMWAAGYMQGRLENVEGMILGKGHFPANISDLVQAFAQVCPQIPEMSIAEFAANLAADAERSARPLGEAR